MKTVSSSCSGSFLLNQQRNIKPYPLTPATAPSLFFIKFNSKENKRKFFPKNKPKECTLFNQTAVPFSFPLCWEEKSEGFSGRSNIICKDLEIQNCTCVKESVGCLPKIIFKSIKIPELRFFHLSTHNGYFIVSSQVYIIRMKIL